MKREDLSPSERNAWDLGVARSQIAELLRALEQWKCPSCGGSGVYKHRNFETRGGPNSVPCKICEGGGLHPTARAAIEAHKAALENGE